MLIVGIVLVVYWLLINHQIRWFVWPKTYGLWLVTNALALDDDNDWYDTAQFFGSSRNVWFWPRDGKTFRNGITFTWERAIPYFSLCLNNIGYRKHWFIFFEHFSVCKQILELNFSGWFMRLSTDHLFIGVLLVEPFVEFEFSTGSIVLFRAIFV